MNLLLVQPEGALGGRQLFRQLRSPEENRKKRKAHTVAGTSTKSSSCRPQTTGTLAGSRELTQGVFDALGDLHESTGSSPRGRNGLVTPELLEHTDHGEWGTARWRASYVFTQTGRPVVNEVFAAFRFDDGLIAEHADSFSFKSWAAQALGRHARVPGTLRVLRAAVRRRARRRLQEFMAGERDTAPAGQLPATPRPEPGAP